MAQAARLNAIRRLPARIRHLKDGRQMMYVGSRLHIPEAPLRRFVKLAQTVRSPREVIRRRAAADRLSRTVAAPVRIPRDKGFAAFGPGDLPMLDDLVRIGAALHQRSVSSGRDEEVRAGKAARGGKGYLFNLLTEDDLIQHPELLSFATHPQVIRPIAEYLGSVPMLSDVQLWSSVPTGDQPKSSQLFHRDGDDFHQVRLYVHISEVGEDSGPLSVLPASVSAAVAKNLATPFQRTPDDEMYRYCDREELVVLTGPPGSGGFMDTSRCFHYGSRDMKRERVALMFHFVPYTAVKESTWSTLAPDSPLRRADDPLAAMVLSLRPRYVDTHIVSA